MLDEEMYCVCVACIQSMLVGNNAILVNTTTNVLVRGKSHTIAEGAGQK